MSSRLLNFSASISTSVNDALGGRKLRDLAAFLNLSYASSTVSRCLRSAMMYNLRGSREGIARQGTEQPPLRIASRNARGLASGACAETPISLSG